MSAATPREAVAQALAYQAAMADPIVLPTWDDEAREAITALFSGGWLQEVLIEHRDWRQRDGSPDDDWFVCRCGVELETSRRDVEPEYIAHVAERIRHAAGAGA